MNNFGRIHRAETMYCMLYPYRHSLKEDVPKKIRLVLEVNNWISPWHGLKELEKEIPFKRIQKMNDFNEINFLEKG